MSKDYIEYETYKAKKTVKHKAKDEPKRYKTKKTENHKAKDEPKRYKTKATVRHSVRNVKPVKENTYVSQAFVEAYTSPDQAFVISSSALSRYSDHDIEVRIGELNESLKKEHNKKKEVRIRAKISLLQNELSKRNVTGLGSSALTGASVGGLFGGGPGMALGAVLGMSIYGLGKMSKHKQQKIIDKALVTAMNN